MNRTQSQVALPADSTPCRDEFWLLRILFPLEREFLRSDCSSFGFED